MEFQSTILQDQLERSAYIDPAKVHNVLFVRSTQCHENAAQVEMFEMCKTAVEINLIEMSRTRVTRPLMAIKHHLSRELADQKDLQICLEQDAGTLDGAFNVNLLVKCAVPLSDERRKALDVQCHGVREAFMMFVDHASSATKSFADADCEKKDTALQRRMLRMLDAASPNSIRVAVASEGGAGGQLAQFDLGACDKAPNVSAGDRKEIWKVAQVTDVGRGQLILKEKRHSKCKVQFQPEHRRIAVACQLLQEVNMLTVRTPLRAKKSGTPTFDYEFAGEIRIDPVERELLLHDLDFLRDYFKNLPG